MIHETIVDYYVKNVNKPLYKGEKEKSRVVSPALI